jgi:hypothetical protein
MHLNAVKDIYIHYVMYKIANMSRLNMDFDDEEDQSISTLKKEYGIKQTTELMRFLIRQTYKEYLRSSQNLLSSSSSKQ